MEPDNRSWEEKMRDQDMKLWAIYREHDRKVFRRFLLFCISAVTLVIIAIAIFATRR